MSGLAFAALLLRDAGAILIVKATVVLALADGVAAAAKCLSAAQRHMIRLVALSSCVWLVLSSGMMPAITIQPPMVGTSFVATGPHLPGGALPSAGSAATTRTLASTSVSHL